ncbi:MAG TPA: ABC transporter permease subunit [Candidatus Limnocylindria bacterium]|nr:ABC transporter permease subunit [Candidatus Limnocylindria bacterium]
MPLAPVARGAAGLAALFLLLEAITRAELVNPVYLPPASTVVATAARLLLDPVFLASVGGTLVAWGLGLAAAAVVAVPLGLLLGASRRAHAATAAAIELLRPIPSVALIPLAILLLGRGIDMRVALVAYAATWPLLFNTVYGAHAVDPVALEMARAYGLGRWAVARHVAFPSALPFVLTGLRISAAIALILAISTELIAGGGAGLGTWMLSSSQTGVPRELLYAGIVVAGLLGLVIDRLMLVAERRLVAWHPRLRAA